MSVNVPSGVKHPTQPLTSTFSASSYALRMISSLFMGLTFLSDLSNRSRAASDSELRAQECGDEVVGRARGLEEADVAREDVGHALPCVHVNTVVGTESKRVVKEDLRSPHVDLDGRRSACRAVERGCPRVPRIVITEVLTGARFESRSRHQRIVRGLALEAPSGERE